MKAVRIWHAERERASQSTVPKAVYQREPVCTFSLPVLNLSRVKCSGFSGIGGGKAAVYAGSCPPRGLQGKEVIDQPAHSTTREPPSRGDRKTQTGSDRVLLVKQIAGPAVQAFLTQKRGPVELRPRLSHRNFGAYQSLPPPFQIKMLTDRKHELERRLSAMMEENSLLQGTVEELQDRVLILERQSHEKDLQLHQSQLELQEVRLSYRQLQLKVEELSEERSLQHFSSTSASLLSEIEQSMEAEELEQEREQLRLQLWEAYCQVRYLCTHLRGNDSADSAVSTDSSMDESSETSSAKDVPAGSLRAALSELKRLIQSVIEGTDSPPYLFFGRDPGFCGHTPLTLDPTHFQKAAPAGFKVEFALTHGNCPGHALETVGQDSPTQQKGTDAFFVAHQSSRRSDDDALEEQIKQTSEDSRALRELMEGERGKLRQSLEELQQLHSQVTLLSVEMTSLKEERDRLRGSVDDKEMNEQIMKAIRDRDDAIAKKNAVEMELAKCKIDMMSLNSQLLDAIQQKLNLSQQLEAWQEAKVAYKILLFLSHQPCEDDMQRVIDQQLMDKHPKEWSQPTYSFSSGHGAKRCARPSPLLRPEQRGSEPIGAEGNRLFSFFKKN
ncbi:BICD family-like cargo adapter 1 [Varanus komodoensis]|nr:BICD family-like cargo adapter 1 [Varanus komodoensis]